MLKDGKVDENNHAEENISDDKSDEEKIVSEDENQTSEPEDQTLSALRQKISDDGSNLGVAYLGYNDGTLYRITVESRDNITYIDGVDTFECFSDVMPDYGFE